MKNIIKNKKAELTTTEIVKIILAVIGISILIYLAVGLYGIFINKGNDVEQAKASLDNLYSGINKIESGEKISVEEMYSYDVLTVPANLAGNCCISIPVGNIDDLPIGMQIMCDKFQEQKLFQIARLI